jgi:hypothetical protein
MHSARKHKTEAKIMTTKPKNPNASAPKDPTDKSEKGKSSDKFGDRGATVKNGTLEVA